MSQILSQVPRQLLQQRQQLTPQLIQAMDILQLPLLALESRIAQELDANPALEYTPGDDDAGPDPTARTAPGDASGTSEGAADFDRLNSLVREYGSLYDDEHRGQVSRQKLSDDADSRLDALSNAAARPESLRDHLLGQWSLIDLDERTRTIGTAIIEVLDAAGRLPMPLDDVPVTLDPAPTAEERETALFEVQQLEPAGVASRSIPECLLLQLEAMPGDNSLEQRIISDHFEDLRKNRLPAIAKALGVDVEEVKDAIAVIARLSLHPGHDVVAPAAPTVTPDVIVEFNEDTNQYEARLTRGNSRELRIAPEFRELLEQARSDKSTRDFVKQKIEAAAAIIDAVQYRRNRLLETANAVVQAQREFLDHGEQHLKVLRMSELADRFGCDPSTISRTVDEKYIQTPQGLFPLRKFFTGGTESESGELIGWDSVKAKVQEIIANEDKASPLNDDEIVEQLRKGGIDIKRRTVAKYRDQLGIPNSRQRRQY